MFRVIVEEKSFEQSIQRLGGAQGIDPVLTALYTGLAYRPEGFPLAGDRIPPEISALLSRNE